MWYCTSCGLEVRSAEGKESEGSCCRWLHGAPWGRWRERLLQGAEGTAARPWCCTRIDAHVLFYGKRVVAFLPEGVGDSVTEWDVPTCAVPACALFYVVLVKLV